MKAWPFVLIFICLYACSTATPPSQSAAPPPVQEVLPKYDRKEWGSWADEDGDGLNTRHELLLQRSLTHVVLDEKGRKVLWGEWNDYYHPSKIHSAKDADIDHLVPLKNAFLTGGDQWDAQQRRRFANDPKNLVITQKKFNRMKGPRGIDAWLPQDKAYACRYMRDFQKIKKKYGLHLTSAEADTIRLLAPECLNLPPIPFE